MFCSHINLQPALLTNSTVQRTCHHIAEIFFRIYSANHRNVAILLKTSKSTTKASGLAKDYWEAILWRFFACHTSRRHCFTNHAEEITGTLGLRRPKNISIFHHSPQRLAYPLTVSNFDIGLTEPFLSKRTNAAIFLRRIDVAPVPIIDLHRKNLGFAQHGVDGTVKR